MFFNEVVGKKNKHKNRKAIWFEYIYFIGQRYVFIGRVSTRCPMEVLSYPEMKKIGGLNLSELPDGKNVWLAIIPVTTDSGTAYYLLMFDRDSWAGLYGNIHWYYAEEFAENFYEYPDEITHIQEPVSNIQENDNAISVFPNPASDLINIWVSSA